MWEVREFKMIQRALLHLTSAEMPRSQQRAFPRSDLVKHHERLSNVYSQTGLTARSQISLICVQCVHFSIVQWKMNWERDALLIPEIINK